MENIILFKTYITKKPFHFAITLCEALPRARNERFVIKREKELIKISRDTIPGNVIQPVIGYICDYCGEIVSIYQTKKTAWERLDYDSLYYFCCEYCREEWLDKGLPNTRAKTLRVLQKKSLP